MQFANSHWGKGTIGVSTGCLLLAWPPAAAWIGACFLLLWGCHHLQRGFQEEYAEEIKLDRQPERPEVMIEEDQTQDVPLGITHEPSRGLRDGSSAHAGQLTSGESERERG